MVQISFLKNGIKKQNEATNTEIIKSSKSFNKHHLTNTI